MKFLTDVYNGQPLKNFSKYAIYKIFLREIYNKLQTFKNFFKNIKIYKFFTTCFIHLLSYKSDDDGEIYDVLLKLPSLFFKNVNFDQYLDEKEMFNFYQYFRQKC